MKASVLDALQWRYATKQFDPSRKIDPATWDVLEQALVLSPSSFGLQPWRFHVIDGPATREALLPASWNQRQVVDASHFVVFTVKHPLTPGDVRSHIERTAEVQRTDVESLAGFESVVLDFLGTMSDAAARAWASRQVYIALGTFMTAAAMLEIDTCPMEGIDPSAYDRILHLEGSGYATLAGCAAGFRHPEDKSSARPKARYPRSFIISHTS